VLVEKPAFPRMEDYHAAADARDLAGRVVLVGENDHYKPLAVRLRALRLAALAAGSPASELFRTHVVALADLVPGPPGPVRGKQVQLPGHVTAYREGNLLKFRRTAVSG
jgi:hypothetical protein